MELITDEIKAAFKKQGDTSDVEPKDINIIMKLFNPVGAGTWYCYDIEEDGDTLWCFANLNDRINAECGTVSLRWLKSRALPCNLKIERDLWFGEHTLQEAIDNVESGKWQ